MKKTTVFSLINIVLTVVIISIFLRMTAGPLEKRPRRQGEACQNAREQLADLKKAILVKSPVYHNEMYGFEIHLFTESPPSTRDWMEKRHPNMPRRLWEATFMDRYFGSPAPLASGTPVVHLTVNECRPTEDITACLLAATGPCGTVTYADIDKFYGKGKASLAPFTFRNLPALAMKISCSGDIVREGMAVLKDGRLYTALFLTSPEAYTPFPRGLVALMMSTFKFNNETHGGGPGENDAALERLPDLVVKSIDHEKSAPSVSLRYCNIGGAAPKKEKFLIKLESSGGTFTGDPAHPLSVPYSGECRETAGIPMGSVGAQEGDIRKVTATVDWKDEVRESNESNNSMTRIIEFGHSGKTLPDPGDGSSIPK